MPETISVTIPNRNTLIGKIIFMVILGVLFGYLMALDEAKDFKEGQELTLEEYTQNFEQYKNGLTEDPLPMWGAIVIMLMMTVVFFGLYELFGWLFGLIIGTMLYLIKNPAKGNGSNLPA